MEVKINVINEMKKLRSTTYANKYAWVKELIQNGQRAKAKHIYVNVKSDSITIEDDGIGCTDPEMLFEKNVSGWDETIVNNENPFGEGFFSTLMAANNITVESIGFKCVFDVERMFTENTTDVIEVTKTNRKSGFKITLTNLLDYVRDYNVTSEFRQIGKYIKNPKIVINNVTVKYEGTTPKIDKPFIHYINNDYFKGWIRPYSWYTDYESAIIKCFAFDRLIKDSTKVSNVIGVVTFNPNRINLRSPDREEFIFDDKYDAAWKAFTREIKKMCLKIIRQGTDKDINDYQYLIDKFTDVDDYKHLIKFKFIHNKKETTINDDTVDVNNSNNSELCVVNPKLTNINNADYLSDDCYVGHITFEMVDHNNKMTKYTNGNCNQTGESIDGRSDFGFYVDSSDVSEYADEIALAQYYNIPVVEIRNRLEENIISLNKKFRHIKNINSSIRLNCEYSNTTPNTSYEIRVLQVLNKIMEVLDIKQNLFVICDTDINKVVIINNKERPIEQLDVLATAYNGTIYLNRKHLYAYKNLNTESDEFTIEDIRFVMLNLETICHEMSHALYGNDDNTKTHLECINYLMQKIINVIFNCKDKPICI